MQILVTGAGGYIGTSLVPLLLEAGHSVRAIDLFAFGDRLASHGRLEKIEEDVRSLPSWALEDVEAVIDLVAISNDPAGEAYRGQTWEINRKARATTARRAKAMGAKRYILPSSCAVYGFAMGEVDEASPINPLTTYAKANAAAERDVLALNDDSFTVWALRQATVFGVSPRMRFDIAVNVMTHDAIKTKAVTVNGDGSQWRPFVHVKDAARAQMMMLKADRKAIGGQVFNVVGENVQLGQLASMIAAETGATVKSAGETDKRSYRVNGARLKTAGWTPLNSIRNGIAEIASAISTGSLAKTPDTITLDWYKKNGTFGPERVRSAA